MLTKYFLTLVCLCCYLAQAESFTDGDYRSLLNESKKRHQTFVIYTWSPHMVLSQKGLDEIWLLHQSLGIEVVPLLDPKTQVSGAEKMVVDHHWPPSALRTLDSTFLIQLGMRRHYPSYAFVQEGKLASPLVAGYKLAGELQSLLKRYAR